jgi:MoaA/NifB/PqqE/SkfB family radical SAM enzyme
MEGIRFYQELGVDIRINTVLMRSNMEDMSLLVQDLHDQNLAVFVRRLIPAGRANGMSPDMLSREEYAMFEKRVAHLLDDPHGLIKGHYLREGNEPLSRIELPFQRHGCSAGHRGLVVLPNGKVQTCGFLGPLGERSVGILPSEKLSVVWRRLIASKHIESLRALLPNHNAKGCGPCTNCLAIALAHETSEEH